MYFQKSSVISLRYFAHNTSVMLLRLGYNVKIRDDSTRFLFQIDIHNVKGP